MIDPHAEVHNIEMLLGVQRVYNPIITDALPSNKRGFDHGATAREARTAEPPVIGLFHSRSVYICFPVPIFFSPLFMYRR